MCTHVQIDLRTKDNDSSRCLETPDLPAIDETLINDMKILPKAMQSQVDAKKSKDSCIFCGSEYSKMRLTATKELDEKRR